MSETDTGVIRLLSDQISNQIAAGEVVLRPSSVVKELLENAIDAQADAIELIVENGGKNLIKLLDNGQGMSFSDLRLCFERHATSKISKAEDLEAIVTKGFRGEALAAINAVAWVEVFSRQKTDEVGSTLQIEAGKILKHESTVCNLGTTFLVKNLFFNIPARRKFLKKEAIEFRHIVDEFVRVALVHPAISFKLVHNDRVIHDFFGVNFKQRIAQIYGNNIDAKLIPIKERTSLVSIEGFIGQPQFAKKRRGNQYLFVNDRFFQHRYFHHAVCSAYEGLIVDKNIPAYFLKFTVDPSKIDINVHPQKIEILFEDESQIYTLLKSSIRRALGYFETNLSFEEDPTLHTHVGKTEPVPRPIPEIDWSFNPFANDEKKQTTPKEFSSKTIKQTAIFSPEIGKSIAVNQSPPVEKHDTANGSVEFLESKFTPVSSPIITPEHYDFKVLQWKRKFLLVAGDFLSVIHLGRLRVERIFRQLIENKADFLTIVGGSKRLLFPINLALPPDDLELLWLRRTEMEALGFEFDQKTNTMVAAPASLNEIEAKDWLAALIKENYLEMEVEQKKKKICQKIARSQSNKNNANLSEEQCVDWVLYARTNEIKHRFDGALIHTEIDSLEAIEKKFQ